MMRFLVSLAAMLAVCAAFPQEPPPASAAVPSPPAPPPAGDAAPSSPAAPPASAAAPSSPALPPPPPPPAPIARSAQAVKASGDQNATIIESNAVIDAEGNFNYSYELSNGIKAQQSGQQQPKQGRALHQASEGESTTESDEGNQVVSGSFSFVAPNGQTISVRYTADETGFHPMIDYGGQSSQ